MTTTRTAGTAIGNEKCETHGPDNPAAVMLARHGEEALKNNFIDYIRRDWSSLEAGSMWVSDHRQFDAPVKIWDEEEQKFKAVRPWICAMMDAKSWFIAGWTISVESPNSKVIQDTLITGIRNNQMRTPNFLHTDNGKDFLAAGFATPVELEGGHKHSILRELGIATVTSLPYNARAKTVERMFKDVAQSFDKYFAAYLGNKPSARPDVAQYFYKDPSELPSLEQFCQAWTAWLEQYHATPKNGEIHGGLSPAAIWDGRKLDKPAWTLERLKFATLMPEPSLRQVHRGPAISLDKKEYFSEKLWSYLDKKILIKADTEDPDRVFAFEVDGRLICECRTRGKIKALAVMDGEESREQISEGMSRQRK